MNISFKISEDYFKKIMADLETENELAVISHSISVLEWVLSEQKKGRQIVSANADGSEPVILQIPKISKQKTDQKDGTGM